MDTKDCRLMEGKKLEAFKNMALTANSLAGYAGRSNRLLNIEDAYNIPSECPFCFHPDFDQSTGYVTKSILTIPLNDTKKSVTGVLQIINRLDCEGRATAVADVFDGLCSNRAYKDTFDDALVCRIMEQERGHHFDPELIDILIENQSKFLEIRNRFPETADAPRQLG